VAQSCYHCLFQFNSYIRVRSLRSNAAYNSVQYSIQVLLHIISFRPSLIVSMFFLSSLLLASFLHISRSAASAGLAPYICPESPLVDNSYIVALHRNHTFEAHFDFIGLNLSETASSFIPIEIVNSYIAVLDNHTVHDLIRHDPGVRYVEHDAWHHTPEPEIHAPSYNYTPPQAIISRRWSETVFNAAPWWVAMLTVANKLTSGSANSPTVITQPTP
jgi:hypothetical protein